MIALSHVEKEAYSNQCTSIDSHLESLPRRHLSLDLSNFFDTNETMDIFARVRAYTIIPEPEDNWDYYAFCFEPIADKESQDKFSDMIRNLDLNHKITSKLRGFSHSIEYKPPEPIEKIIESIGSNEDLFNFFVGWGYNVRYNQGENVIHTHDIYSGHFKNQGLMTWFYQSLQKVVDFDDIDQLEVEDIVQGSTVKMFNNLRAKIPNDDYLCEMLKRKYVKSPFMRMFNRIGFRDMEILADYGYIIGIHAKKADELHFHIKE